jgi:hypothetical protein
MVVGVPAEVRTTPFPNIIRTHYRYIICLSIGSVSTWDFTICNLLNAHFYVDLFSTCVIYFPCSVNETENVYSIGHIYCE